MNVQTLNNKVATVFDFFDKKELDILVLQETGLSNEAFNAIDKMARRKKFRFHAIAPRIQSNGKPFEGLAVLSSWPCRPIRLQCYQDPTIALRVQALHVQKQKSRPFVLVNLHLQSGDKQIAMYQCNQLLQELKSVKDSVLMIGDWNLIPEQTPIAQCLAANIGHLGGGGILPTRSSGRCIDFAVGLNGMQFQYHAQSKGVADHDCVVYTAPVCKPADRYCQVPRISLNNEKQNDEQWNAFWCQNSSYSNFVRQLDSDDLDGAWNTLSLAFETSLLTLENGRPVNSNNNIVSRGIVLPPRLVSPFSSKSKLPELTAERRLQRYIRRLKEWKVNPCPQLYKKISQDRSWVTQRWPELTEPAVTWNESALESIAQQYVQERQAADKASRLREIALSDSRTFAWLKRPTCTEPNSSMQDELPIDPALQVVHLQKMWNKLWLQKPLNNHDDLADFLPSTHEIDFLAPKACTLWKLAQAASGKAAGPDGWRGSDFAKLAPAAFEPLSLLWKKCLQLGKIPETWAHARTIFIDKPSGDGKRPLSIAAICWRLLASAAVANLKPWIQNWADDSLCGGLPGHRADELHVRLFRAFHSLGNPQNKTVQGLKQDLKKCFDNCCHHQALHILVKFGMPTTLARVIRCFYQMHTRWIESSGCVARNPTRPTRSILQGCPFSVMMLSGIMTVWCQQMKLKVPRIQLGVFVDDRTIWTEDNTATLKLAVHTSQQLDAIFGFKNNVEKESFFSNKPWVRQRLKSLGKVAPAFTLLGIHYCINMRASCVESKRITERVLLILSRIGFLIRSRDRRRHLVASLVIPAIVWASFWMQPSKKMLQKWTAAIERCILGHIAPGRSPTLVWALLGLRVHPAFQSLLQGLRNLRWQHLHFCQHTKDLYVTPVSQRLLDRIGWNVSVSGNVHTPHGTLNFECDSLKSITALAEQDWLKSLWASDKRVAPAERSQWPDLQIQKRAGKTLDQLNWQHESVITGAGVDGRMLSKFKHTDVSCLCNINNPTRRHLTWQCETFAAKRFTFFSGRNLPSANTAAEGLLVLSRSVSWYFEPGCLLQNGLQLFGPHAQEKLLRIVESAFQQPHSNLSILATDGGSFQCNLGTRGSWGIANCNHAIGGKLQGLDQSSYAAEITAVLILLFAIEQKNHKLSHDVAILIDNQDVARKFALLLCNPHKDPPVSWEYFAIWKSIALLIRNLPFTCFSSVWVPSHDKQPDWKPSLDLPPSFCRHVNALADAAAADALNEHAVCCLLERKLETDRHQWMQHAVNFQLDALIALHRNYDRMAAMNPPPPTQGVG